MRTSWDLKHREFTGSEFIFNFQFAVRDLVIDYLRLLFKYSELAKEYRWSENERETKVFIGAEFPLEERFFPRIIVKVDVVQEERLGFGDVGQSDKDYFVLTGRFRYRGVIYVSATEDKKVMDLADITLLFLANRFYRAQLQNYGVGIIDSDGYRLTGIRREALTAVLPVFTTEISFSLYSEWQQLIKKQGITIKGEAIELTI